MIIERIGGEFSICKVKSIDPGYLDDEFCFVGKTDEEVSLVCGAGREPHDAIEVSAGWKALRIQGVLDFSLIGVLAPIAAMLAENQIGIFVVSTFNTDYILVKADDYEKATSVLQSRGYKVV